MKIIQILSDRIEEENNDAKFYIKLALEKREEMPALADVFYKLSLEETKHMNTLHGEVVKIIQKYRAEHGEPPEAMQAVYDFLHRKHIEAAAEVKSLQLMYQEKGASIA